MVVNEEAAEERQGFRDPGSPLRLEPIAMAEPITRSALRDVFAGDTDVSGLIRLSRHCVERYHERFKPGLSINSARGDLYRRMREAGIFTAEKPRWILMTNTAALGWIVIDDDIALPIREDTGGHHSLVAVTALYRLQ